MCCVRVVCGSSVRWRTLLFAGAVRSNLYRPTSSSAEEQERVNRAPPLWDMQTSERPLRVVGHNHARPTCCRSALDHLLTQRGLVHHENV